MNDDIRKLAELLWEYHHMNQHLVQSDIILVLGNSDINTILHGIELFKMGYAPYLVISGGSGKITRGQWKETEAEVFYRIAIENGIPQGKLFIEKQSTNTGENYLFTKQLLEINNISYQDTIVVTKPYMERRAFATAKIHWPNINLLVSSKLCTLEEYIGLIGNENLVINLMVGDLQRIKIYPDLGFQIKQNIPKNVELAFEKLVLLGYTQQLLK